MKIPVRVYVPLLEFNQLAANVTSGNDLDWHAIDWKRSYRIVKNLRQRIFRASREGDLKKVRSLQRLMLRCRANVMESVRRVTQVNQGKLTPGIDKAVVRTPEARTELCKKLSQLELHKVYPVSDTGERITSLICG
jgi:RNA-directed DNA polymerase